MSSIKQLISDLREQNIKLVLKENDIEVMAFGKKLSQDIIQTIKSNKREIVEYLHSIEIGNHRGLNEINRCEPAESYPLSSSQMRLWILSQVEASSVAYNMPSFVELEEGPDIESFIKSIHFIVERHEILRTVFREDRTGEIRQWILEPEALGFQVAQIDFSKEENSHGKAEVFIQADLIKPFDLEKGPLLRTALIRTAENKYLFYFNLHHIISDGWSMEVLAKEILLCYEACKQQEEPRLPQLRIQYKDYAVWQLKQLNGPLFEEQKRYWLDRLSGIIAPITLPIAKNRPEAMTNVGHSVAIYISSQLSGQLKAYCKNNGGSLFIGLLTTWSILFSKYIQQSDIVIGTAIAGRDHAGLGDQIGFYINALALRNYISEERSFNEIFSQVKASTLAAYARQDFPFDEVVKGLNLQRDRSRAALFDVMLALQNTMEEMEDFDLDEEQIEKPIDTGAVTSKTDILITTVEMGKYLYIDINYNTDIYEQSTIDGLLKKYVFILNKLLSEPESAIERISIQSETARQLRDKNLKKLKSTT